MKNKKEEEKLKLVNDIIDWIIIRDFVNNFDDYNEITATIKEKEGKLKKWN